MNIHHLLLFSMTIICSIHIHSMEQQAVIQTNNKPTWLTIPKDVWIYIVAHYHIKDNLRKICTYLHKLASSTNTDILMHPSLVLSEKALERFVLFHTASGDSAIVRNLLAKGANPNACNNKMTLMHYATQYGYVEIVEILLKHHALNITNIIDSKDESPFDLAIKYDKSVTIKQIIALDNIFSEDLLCYAAEKGALNCVRTLLTCNINVNSPNSKGNYPLSCAVYYGHTHIIRLLIINGAQVNYYSPSENNINATPLHFAALRGHESAVQLLIEYGADVNTKTSNEYTPLDLANKNAIKKLLIAHGGKTSAELKPLKLKKIKPKKPKNDNCVIQ